MRFYLFLFLLITGKSWLFSQTIVLPEKQIPVSELIHQISSQSDWLFSFESSLLQGVRPVTLNSSEFSVEELLHLLFNERNIDHRIMGGYIILFPKSETDIQTDSVVNRRLREVMVTAGYLPHGLVSQTTPSHVRLNSRLLRLVPSPGSESDVLKTLQLLPGVNHGSDGKSDLYVRGGNGDENLFLLDGTPLYNPNHFFGFLSAFDGNLLESVGFYKGGFPARYGSRLSSVTDMTVKSGNPDKLSGKVSVGLISSGILLEGPLRDERTTFLISARRTYLDLIAAPLYKMLSKKETLSGEEQSGFSYNFTDVNTKVVHRFAPRHTIAFTGYWGLDVFSNHMDIRRKEPGILEYSKESERLRWGNTLAAINYSFPVASRVDAILTTAYTHYQSRRARRISYGRSDGNRADEFSNRINDYTRINDITGRLHLQWHISANNTLSFGSEFIHHRFTPELIEMRTDSEKKISETSEMEKLFRAEETTLYAENNYTSGLFDLSAGVRMAVYHTAGKNYFSLQPRMALAWKPAEFIQLNTSYAEMTQYVHRVYNDGSLMSLEKWIPVTDKLRPMHSRQVTAGVSGKFLSGWEISAEGYYKWLRHIADYRDGILRQTAFWEEGLAQGNGSAYGVEWLLKKNSGKTTGWIGYTLAWANRKYPNGLVNGGNRFPARFDTRHAVNIVATHRFSDRFDMSATWSFHSGARATVSLEEYQIGGVNPGGDMAGGVVVVPEERNNFILPPYHRLDLSFHFYRRSKRGLSTWSLDLYNAYCRFNTTSVRTSRYWSGPNAAPQVQVYYSWLLPIVPSFSYSFTF